MRTDPIYRWIRNAIRFPATCNRSGIRAHKRNKLPVEPLEPRMLLSESASAQLSLTSTTGTVASPVYHYSITVTDTGTTNIGTFWFGWVPGEDFLPSAPVSESSPAGWGSAVTGSDNQTDGSAIQWIATSNAITPGNSLSGFAFTTPDSPTALAGKSPDYPSTDVLVSTVYSGGPFSDGGFQFTVAPASTTSLAASTTTVVPSQSAIDQGGPVTFTATVAPSSGTGATPTGSVTFLENGNSIGSQPVQSNGTAVLMTSSLPSGSLSITAQYSGDSTYSGSTSSPVTETVNPSAQTTTALVPSIIKSTLPTTLVAGNAAHGVVTLDITNTTAATVKGKFSLEIFASTDGSIDSSSIELAHLPPRTLDVKTTGPLSTSLQARILTGELPAGSYTLLARVIDLSGNNSDSSTGPTLNVAAPVIALSETFVKMTIPSSVGAGTRSHAVAVLDITNNGNITTPRTTTVALFATIDGALGSTATQIISVPKPLRIRAGQSTPFTIHIKEIPAIAVGPYTIVAQVTDPNGNMTTATSTVVNIVTPSQDPPTQSTPTPNPPYNY